jgi:hypothetical protein
VIPVQPQPEPEDFSARVREKGSAFLHQVPRPTSTQWKGKEYWRAVIPDMRCAYKGICAYSAHWISHVTGSQTIDHFVPRALRPDLAYEWSNFRYVASRFNSRKGLRTILDPFELEPDWFIIKFPSLMIKPTPGLFPDQQRAAWDTIKYLKLNDEDCVQERQQWVEEFCNGEINFIHLVKKAPFIAYEIQRQGLVDSIAAIMNPKVKTWLLYHKRKNNVKEDQ